MILGVSLLAKSKYFKARANARNMLGPTMLRLVGQQRCERLHGPLDKDL